MLVSSRISVLLRKPEIDNIDVRPLRALVSDRKVLWLDISVNITMRVHELQSAYHLFCYITDCDH
jgi:hypothetical protein